MTSYQGASTNYVIPKKMRKIQVTESFLFRWLFKIKSYISINNITRKHPIMTFSIFFEFLLEWRNLWTLPGRKSCMWCSCLLKQYHQSAQKRKLRGGPWDASCQALLVWAIIYRFFQVHPFTICEKCVFKNFLGILASRELSSCWNSACGSLWTCTSLQK